MAQLLGVVCGQHFADDYSIIERLLGVARQLDGSTPPPGRVPPVIATPDTFRSCYASPSSTYDRPALWPPGPAGWVASSVLFAAYKRNLADIGRTFQAVSIVVLTFGRVCPVWAPIVVRPL